MPNDIERSVRFRGGVQISESSRELTDEEQAAKNRGRRLGEFKGNGSPSQVETAQALQDLMEQLGI